MRGEIVPPSKFIVGKKSPPKGGLLIRGVYERGEVIV